MLECLKEYLKIDLGVAKNPLEYLYGVTATLEMALQTSGCDQLPKHNHKPRLLSDNGPGYIAAELADWLENNGMDHVRGAPCHPQTQEYEQTRGYKRCAIGKH